MSNKKGERHRHTKTHAHTERGVIYMYTHARHALILGNALRVRMAPIIHHEVIDLHHSGQKEDRRVDYVWVEFPVS